MGKRPLPVTLVWIIPYSVAKLTGSIEYYKNTTKDLLIAFPVSGSGYDYQYRNLGKTENKGFEISLTWNIISKKNYGELQW